jgi:DNA polymerase-3 subunit delta
LTSQDNPTYLRIVSPAELAKEIDAGQFRAVYYFYGPEDYRIKEAEKKLTGIFLPRRIQSTNHVILSAAKGKFEDILNELSMIPMLGERQVFVINDIQSLSPPQIEKILNILTPPDPNRVVIFASPSSKIPRKTTKLFKLLVSKTMAVEFPRLPMQSARGKIKALLKEEEIEIEPDALNMLAELGDGDMGGLVGEVGKLIDYVGEAKIIKSEDVAAVTSDYQAFKVFELADKVAVGQIDKALNIIDFLIKKGEKPSGLMFWLSEHFINLYLTKNRKPIGRSKKDMSWKYKPQVGLFENNQLEKIIKFVAEANFDLRNNVRPEKLILERLIFNICSTGKKEAKAK